MTSMRLKSVFSELRRRRLFNTVAIYIVGAWVALQVAELALPALEIPDAAIRYVWIGTFALFPLVLLFGWRYDISKGGVRRTFALNQDPETPQVLKRFDHWFIGSLSTAALAVIAVVLVRIAQVEPEILQAAPENSIVVMPFEVCEGRSADQPIAYQLANEVTNRLAERNTLKVISRVTAYKLAGFGWGASRISSQIGVRYVLTGEVCRDGDALTISAELRDQDDFIVVQDTYEQVVNPFEQIELRVATQVADAVAAQLGDVTPFGADLPVNRLAYEQLLFGREFVQHRDWENAKASFERALELQPGYPDAVFELAFMELRLNPEKALVERLALARQKAGEALELARGEIERGAGGFNAHFVIAKIQHMLAHGDQAALWRGEAIDLDEAEIDQRKKAAHELFVESEKHLRIALSKNPSHTEAYRWLVDTIEHQGIERRAEALEMMQRVLERDPLNEEYSSHLANRLAGRGRYREAMELLDRFAGLPSGKSELYWTQLEIQGNLGRFDDKFATMIEALKTDPEWGDSLHLSWLASQMAELGMYDEAAEFYQLLQKIPLPEDNWLTRMARDDFYPAAIGRKQEVASRWVEQYAGLSNAEILNLNDILVGNLTKYFWDAGERARAITLFESLHHVQFNATWAERQASLPLILAQMYQDSGRRDDAVPLLETALGYLEREVAAGIRHPSTLSNLAVVHALLGNGKDALIALEMAVDYGLSVGWVSDPDQGWWNFSDPFSGIRDDPRFQVLADRVEAIRAQQVSNIRALLARNDMEALLEPVIALFEEKAAEQLAAD